MSLTIDQNKANLGSAARLAENLVGLDMLEAGYWTREEHALYMSKLAEIILANPGSFNSQSILNAQRVAGIDPRVYDPVDASFDWQAYGNYLTDNAVAAGNDLADLGNGVSNALSSIGDIISNTAQTVENTSNVAQWIIPLGAVVLLYWLVKDPERATRSGANISDAARSWAPY